MQFLRLQLKNWRNFKNVDVQLRRRMFIVGPNASGKSNLLDAFRFLKDVSAKDGGFSTAVNKRSGVSRIRCLAATRNPNVLLRVEIGDDPDAPIWAYELEFNQDKQSRAVVKSETVHRRGAMLIARPIDPDKKDAELLFQTHLEQVSANKEFREIVKFFDSVRYLHIVPQLVREPDRSVGIERDPYGGDFLEQLAGVERTKPKTWESRMKHIREALKVAVPQLGDLELKRDDRGVPHLRGLYEHWRPKGAWQSEDQFSDGTLRLLGLLWAAFEGTGPLLLEEPELSLHPGVIQHIPQMFARLGRRRKTRRQLMVSTHSSELLQDRGIAPEEVLLLHPDKGGTRVELAANNKSIRELLDAGETIAEAVLPMTAPVHAEQLPLMFDDQMPLTSEDQ